MGVAITDTGQILTSISPTDAAKRGATMLSDYSAVGTLEGSHKFNLSIPADEVTHDAGVARRKTTAELDAEAPTRRRAKEAQLLQAMMSYGQSKYSVEQWHTMTAELTAARVGLKLNRTAYFEPTIQWRDSVFAEYQSRRNALRAATTKAAVDSVSLDFSSFDASFPAKISIVDGLAIPD